MSEQVIRTQHESSARMLAIKRVSLLKTGNKFVER